MKIILDVDCKRLASGKIPTHEFVTQALIEACKSYRDHLAFFEGSRDIYDAETRDEHYFMTDLANAGIRIVDHAADSIMVNHENFKLEEGETFITYERVVALAGYDPKYILTVVYHNGPVEKPDGCITPKGGVEAVQGIRFNVADTSNA